MKYNKGDLILVSTVDNQKKTCIVVSSFNRSCYLYVYCLETGMYQLIYDREIDFVIHERFDPDFPNDPDHYNVDYSFYELSLYDFGHIPFWPNPFENADDDDDVK